MKVGAASAIAIVINLSFSGLVIADDCQGILIGIHESKYVTSSESKLKTTLDILKKYEVSSYEQARETAASGGLSLPLKGIPVSFQAGYKADSSGKGQWASQLERYFATHVDEAKQYTEQIETANKAVVEAWVTCILNRKGVRVWAEQENTGDEFVVLVAYNPIDRRVVKIETIEFSDQIIPLTKKDDYERKPLRIDGGPVIVRVKRRLGGDSQAQIVVRTDWHDAYVNLRAFPKVITAPLPPRPNIDFNNDRLSDSLSFVGSNPYSIQVTLGGTGELIKTLLPPPYDPHYEHTRRATADVNNDGFTDLIMVVTQGADYGHIHLSNGDGTFQDNKVFNFRRAANSLGDYSTGGTWEGIHCEKLGRDVLHHMPIPGTHDPKVTGGYYWIPKGDGTQFDITSTSPCS